MSVVNASEILKSVSNAITKKYDPNGNMVFGFAFMNKTSGMILSADIAVLTGKTGDYNNRDVLYVVNPQYLDNYCEPLAALTLTSMGKAGIMAELFYPEGKLHAELNNIVLLIKSILEDLEQKWTHQINWLS
jgi:hypothetical protein